jgi:hypothetical protein
MSIKITSVSNEPNVEVSRFQVLFDKYVKPNKEIKIGTIPFETLFTIIKADPTSRIPEGMDVENVTTETIVNVKIGKYTQWLVKQYTTPNTIDLNDDSINFDNLYIKSIITNYQFIFLEDLYKVTSDLMKYERFKNRLPQEYRDINKLNVETLYEYVKDFSLEKTKATVEEKKEAAKTYEHPGAEITFKGSEWTVVKISDKTQLGKDAACFYGGYCLEPSKGETRWCTSSPGLTWFDKYINKGPLYVVIPNSPRKFNGSMDIGEKSGLPAYRYQFHFQDNHYMDPADRQIDLVRFLMENEDGLRDYFKPEFIKGLLQKNGQQVSVNYPNDSASKFIALYGFDEFFETLPEDIKRLEFVYKGDEPLGLQLPESISKFKQLSALHLVGCISKIPNSFSELKELKFLSLPDNKNLESLPASLADLPNLLVINIKGTNVKTPIPSVLNRFFY